MAYDPARDLTGGEQYSSAVTADERKAAAYNALANTYGVALAGDPDTALKDQEYVQRDKVNPIAVQQAQANLTGTTQQNDYNALANPLKLTGLDLGNQNTAAQTQQTQANTNRTNTLLPGEVAQQGATLNQTNAQTGLTNAETARDNVATRTGQFQLDQLQGDAQDSTNMGILAALSDTASAGGDVGAKFDQLAPLIASNEHLDPAHLQALRTRLVQNPVDTINQLSQGIQAKRMAAAGAAGRGVAGSIQMLKFGQQEMNLKQGLSFTQQRTQAVPAMTDQLASLIPKLSSVAIVRKAKAEIPGTPEYQFEQLMEQLKPNLSLDDIRTLKATGTSLGRVTNAEMAAAGNAFANMDLGQSTSTLAANLIRLKNVYSVVNKNLSADIQRMGTGGMPGVPHASKPSYTAGQVYQDKNGNKATWDGSKFVPVK